MWSGRVGGSFWKRQRMPKLKTSATRRTVEVNSQRIFAVNFGPKSARSRLTTATAARLTQAARKERP